jgi:hypothetical protein
MLIVLALLRAVFGAFDAAFQPKANLGPVFARTQ